MPKQIAKSNPGSVLEQVIINGDLAGLSEVDRVKYYNKICDSIGLNPFSKPLEYIKLNGKLTLYAKRDCADQLRSIHGVSIKILDKDEIEGIYIVSVAAQDKHGRQDEDSGAVNIAGLRGDARANAILKAITKAKRRVTLSICGLGMLDETEIADIPQTKTIKVDLDELFPDDQKIEAVTSPEKADELLIDTPASEKDDPSPAPSEDTTEAFPLSLLTDEVIVYDSSHDFYMEYQEQLKSLRHDEYIEPGKKMTAMHRLETLNEKTLKTLPKVGYDKLYEKRLGFNRVLGPLQKKLEKAKKDNQK